MLCGYAYAATSNECTLLLHFNLPLPLWSRSTSPFFKEPEHGRITYFPELRIINMSI